MHYKANAIADRYMVPCFHQNWKLFAPDVPMYNVELEFRTHPKVTMRSNDISALDSAHHAAQWRDWQDATAFFGHGTKSTMEKVEQNISTQLTWQLMNNLYRKEGIVQYDQVVASPAYTTALFYVMQMQSNSMSIDSIGSWQIRLKYDFTPDAQNVDRRSNQDVVLFPEYFPLPK